MTGTLSIFISTHCVLLISSAAASHAARKRHKSRASWSDHSQEDESLTTSTKAHFLSFDKVASASTLPQFPQQVSTAVTMHFKFSYHVSELRTTKTGYHLQLPIKAFYARVHRQFLACCVASNAIYKKRSDVHQDGSKCKNYATNILNRQN